MNRLNTKKTLSELLHRPEYRVVALVGDWGVGKTHLWTELAEEQHIRHGYFSLFGVKDPGEIIKGLATSLAKLESGDGNKLRKAWGSVSTTLAGTLDKLADANGLAAASLGVLNDILSANVVEGLLRGETVVLDDIERSSEDLTMDLLMGAVDQLRQLKCKIVLILNDTKLDDREAIWRAFYEKVVDIQLTLLTTADEAIDAILSTAPVDAKSSIRSAWIRSGCRNIRLAERAIRAVATIIPQPESIPLVKARLIADIVYLTIAEFHGYAPNANATDALRVMRTVSFSKDPEERGRFDAIRAATKADFSVYRDFQAAVVEFLRTGQIARADWEALLADANEDVRLGALQQQLNDWTSAALWDPTVTPSELENRAQGLLPHAWRLDPPNAQAFIFALKENGISALVDDFIDAWSEGIIANKRSYRKQPLYQPIEPIDPRIEAAIDRLDELMTPSLTLHNALIQRIKFQEAVVLAAAAINRASEAEWQGYLQGATTRENLDLAHSLLRDGGSDVAEGAKKLRSALDQICTAQPGSRLTHILLQRNIVQPASGEGAQSTESPSV